jgi:hypothetical protein
MNNSYLRSIKNAVLLSKPKKPSAAFRLLSSLFLLTFLLVASSSRGQVTTLQNWSNLYQNTATTQQTIAYTVPAGSGTNRVLVVAIASSQTPTAIGSRTVSITYGGQTLTLAGGDMATTTTRQHTAIYYLNEAGIDAASNTNLVFTVSGGTTRVTTVWAAVFDYVDQTTPITNNQNYNSIASNASSNIFVFGTALTINNGDQAVLVLSSLRDGNTGTRTISTLPTSFTSTDQQTLATGDGVRNAILNRTVATSNTTSNCSTTMSGTTRGSMTGVSFKGCSQPTANAGSALAAICKGGTSAALGGTVGGSATGGTWSDGAVGGTFSPSATTLNATYTPPSTYTGTVTLTLTTSGGSCGTATASKNLTVSPVIANNTVSTAQSICTSTTPAALTGSTPTGATGTYVYLWESSTTSGVTGFATASGTSNTINYTPGSLTATTWYRRTVTSGGCSNTSLAIQVTVNPLPVAAGVINGPAVVCQGQANIIYSVPVIANATNYIWTLPSGATIASGSGTNIIYVNYSMTASSGDITVQGTNSCGNGVISANYEITVNITASITTNYSPTICSGELVTVSPADGGGNIVPAGTTYSWGLPAVTGGITGATALSGQTSFTQTLTNPTNITQTASYSVTATTGGCSATTFSVLVTVYPKPIVSGSPATQPICSGGVISPIVFAETSGILGSINYNWTRIDATAITGITGSGSGTITGNLTNATSSPLTAVFRVIATTQNGCASLPFDVNVVVNPIPTVLATLATNQPICSDNTISPITISNPNGVNGTTYSWTRDNTTNVTGIAASGTGASIAGSLTNTTNTVQTTTFTIKATANSCDSSTTTVSITVNPKPTVAVSSATLTVCGGSPIADITLTNPNNVAGTTYSWTRDNNNVSGIIAVGNTGTGATISGSLVNNTNSNQDVKFTITATASGCASTTTTSTVTVKPTPTVAVSNSAQPVCNGIAITTMNITNPNSVTGTTYDWTRDNTNISGIIAVGSTGTGTTISGSLINNTTTTQTTTFTITATATNGCSTKSTATVTVYAPLVAPVISASQDVCNSETPIPLYMSTLVSGGSGFFTYQWQRANNAAFTPGFINVGTATTYAPGEANNDYYYRLIVTDTSCLISVTSNSVFINALGIGTLNTTLSNVPSGPVCPGPITPAIGIRISHLPTSDVVFNWSANGTHITPNSESGGNRNIFGIQTSYTFNFTAINNTNATITTPITITPRFTNLFSTCNSSSSIINIQIRPTPRATANVPSATICSGSSAGIVVRGNITDASTTFNWTRDNFVNVTGAGNAILISSGEIAAGGTYIIPGTLTNTQTTVQMVTYTITPSSNGCSGTPITVTITVAPAVDPGTIADNQIICSGDSPVTFTQTVAKGAGAPTYQWQSSTTGLPGSYSPILGATFPTYTPTGVTVNTWYIRTATYVSSGAIPTVVTGVTYTTNSASCTQNTTPISITINNINPGTIAGTQVICNGDIPIGFTNVTLATGGNTPTYQWQVSTNGADCITDFTDILGATGVGYTPAAGLTVTTYYRRKETSTLPGKACVAYSNCITVTVNNVTAGTVGSNQTICGNNPDAFTVSIAATGSGVLSYQWQSNTTGCGGSWGDILGATAATYDAPPGLLVTTYYRRIVTSTLNGKSCSVNGNCITVTANSVTAGAISGNRTICSGGDPAGFIETTSATGTGITYQWQYSLTGGAGPWTDVSGATSATYDAPGPITQITYFQRVVKASANGTDCTANSNFVVVFVNNVTASVVAGNQTLCSTVDPTAFTVDPAATGTVAPTYQWKSSTTGCGGPWTPIPGATNATYDPPPTNAQTTYFQVVATSTLNGESCSVASNCITVISLSKSWNGSISTDWNTPANWTPAGIPDATNCVIIPDVTKDPIISGTSTTALANTITVSASSSLTVNRGNTLKVIDKVTNSGGTITFEDSASLVQKNDTANEGDIIYKRNYTGQEFDYTYWSSPVASQNLLALSPSTKLDKFFSFNGTDWVQEIPSTTKMKVGKGYIIRGVPPPPPPPPPAFPPGFDTLTFIGEPNNGGKSITVVGGESSNLIGNPYPSAIDADSFILANTGAIDGTLYFWTHNTPIAIGTPNPGTGVYAYSGDDYAAYSLTGGVGTGFGTGAKSGSTKPTGFIAAGQSFFTTSTVAGGDVKFTNAMRVNGSDNPLSNSNFYKTKSPINKTDNTLEKNRVWLNLTNKQGAFKQTLVGYITGASNTWDKLYDGESFDGNDFLDFYSINQDKNLTIQGRALPFDSNDEIPLGYRIALEGTFSINIDETDGLLKNQEVFLEDKVTNKVVNLKEGSYTFNTTAGTFDNRFVLRYKDKTLSTEEPEVEDGILVLYSNNYKTLIIRNNGIDTTVNSVTLYNMIGQKIAYWDVKGREQTSIQIPIKNLPSEIYIVKVKTTKGESNKKIIVK